jgi:uncharacterized protein YdaU (DUF1376 family)
MHYFKRNIGDYHKKAGRLSMIEHGAYTLLIDACYDREKFPTKEDAIDWCWARSDLEIAAVEFVLSKFFTFENGVYLQSRIQEEIEEFHGKASKNKDIAINREAKRRDDRARIVHASSPELHESSPNHKPITINQEPKTNTIVSGDAADLIQIASTSKPTCPHQSIIDLYHAELPVCPRIKDWTPARQTHLRARWNEDTERQDLDYWQRLFGYIATCDFLVGKGGGARPFFAGLEWIVKSENFAKIREGKYQNNENRS